MKNIFIKIFKIIDFILSKFLYLEKILILYSDYTIIKFIIVNYNKLLIVYLKINA